VTIAQRRQAEGLWAITSYFNPGIGTFGATDIQSGGAKGFAVSISIPSRIS